MDNKIGINIKKFREERKISRKNLAEKSNISASGLANYENGNRIPSLEVLINIATVLQVPIDILCGLNLEPVTVPELNLITGFKDKKTGEYIDDLQDHIDDFLNIEEMERINKEYESTPEYKQKIERLNAEYNDENWIKYKNIVGEIDHILIALLIELSLFDDNGISKIKLFDHKDGYTKIFDTYEEAEQFFNEIKHGIQSSVDRLKYYDKNNK